MLAAEIGDIGFPSRTLELYTIELTGLVDLDAIRTGAFQARSRLRLRHGELRDAERARQARRRRARHQPARLDPGRHELRPRRPRRPARRARPLLGRPPRRHASTPTASSSPSSTTPATCSTDDEALLVLTQLVIDGGARRARSPCRSTQAGEVEAICAATGSERALDQARRRPSCWRRLTAPGVASRPTPRGASSSRSSCPPSTPSPASCACCRCSRPATAALSRRRRIAPEAVHRPPRGPDALRAEGPRDADPRRARRSVRSCSCSTA